MNKIKPIIPLLGLTILMACSASRYSASHTNQNSYQQLNAEDRQLADTLIKKIVDNEGLYTVISGLKPMSSVTELYLNIAAKDSTFNGLRNITDTSTADFQKLKRYQRIVNALQFGDLNLMISPYRLTQKGQRAIQISVHRKSLIDSLLNANSTFFGQFGFVPDTSPEILINTTEYEHKYNRFRAYGYLFGYPEYAVSFFTEAALSEAKTGSFVKRDFFQIPVANGKNGRFVYATPKDYQTGPIDTAILQRAKYFLAKYETEKLKLTRADGTVDYYGLLLALNKWAKKR